MFKTLIFKDIRLSVFLPPFLLLVLALGLNFLNPTLFLKTIESSNTWMLEYLKPGFAFIGIFAVLVSVFVYLMPIGSVKVGGNKAVPLLSYWSWILVSVFAHIGAGILFWSVAEPIYHMTSPPVSLGLVTGSKENAVFALSSLFLHWTYTPIALISLPGLAFALAFYNHKLPFSLSSCLVPLIGKANALRLQSPLDSISLYALVLGMSASLATGVLTISGGIEYLGGLSSQPTSWTLVALIIGTGFIFTAVSGIKRGIKFLSHANLYFFIFLAVYLLIVSDSSHTFTLAAEALQQYFGSFIENHLFTRYSPTDPWPNSWTVFYWAVWLAWTPITAGFLGRISVGYTVRQFVIVNLVLPSVFSFCWTALIGGTTLHLQLTKQLDFGSLLTQKGPEALAFLLLSHFPFSFFIIIAFILLIFSAYMTSAASNITAMAGLSCKNISVENPDPPKSMRIIWGLVVLILSIVMLNHSGIQAVKVLSYLGGIPALFFEFLVLFSLIRMSLSKEYLSKTKPLKSKLKLGEAHE